MTLSVIESFLWTPLTTMPAQKRAMSENRDEGDDDCEDSLQQYYLKQSRHGTEEEAQEEEEDEDEEANEEEEGGGGGRDCLPKMARSAYLACRFTRMTVNIYSFLWMPLITMPAQKRALSENLDEGDDDCEDSLQQYYLKQSRHGREEEAQEDEANDEEEEANEEGGGGRGSLIHCNQWQTQLHRHPTTRAPTRKMLQESEN